MTRAYACYMGLECQLNTTWKHYSHSSWMLQRAKYPYTGKNRNVRHWRGGAVDKIYNMEYLRFSEGDERKDFEEKWKEWTGYKHTMGYAEVMGV